MERDVVTAPEKLERPNCQALDDMLGHPLKVLDQGFVRVVDYLGTDDSIVQAARVSYGKGTFKANSDMNLLRLLMRNQHTSPFEQCELKLHVRVPMDCWRQWIRHRTANVNEYSTRYSEAIDATQQTLPIQWRTQAKNNKQGSGEMLPESVGKTLSDREGALQNFARHIYQERLTCGVAREQARKDLPLCTYTEAYWKIDLHNLLHFLRLRMDSHAQWEIRQYAHTIGHQIVKKWVPTVWNAFDDYHLRAVKFHFAETEILAALLAGKSNLAVEIFDDMFENSPREKKEFIAKLERLNYTWPPALKTSPTETPLTSQNGLSAPGLASPTKPSGSTK